MRSSPFIVVAICFIAATALLGVDVRERVKQHQPKMSYLDNGIVKVGIDLNLGGSITYLSKSGIDQNMINSWDFGRQIQMSHYAGPVPFEVDGKKPNPEWEHIGWNPIQAGDAFGHSAEVLQHTNDGKQMYVKCVPMHWPLDNVPGECTFETWLELKDMVVSLRCRINNNRPDHRQWEARGQELPAVYTNGPWHRLITYSGNAPFTGGALSKIENPPPGMQKSTTTMWSSFWATEHWAALVDDHDFGLGVFNPDCVRFVGGFAGKPGKGGPLDSPTGYFAPLAHEIIDWNISSEYRCDLIVGSLEEIRQHVYKNAAQRQVTPAWSFQTDRSGWSYTNATDAGWPIKGELVVDLSQHNPQINSPVSFWRAEDAHTLVIEAAAKVSVQHARVYWYGPNDNGFNAEKSMPFEITGGEEYQIYRIPLAEAKGWEGAILQVRFDPNLGPGMHPGDWIKIRSVRFEK